MNIANWLLRSGLDAADLPAVRLGADLVADHGELARGAAGIAAGLGERYGLRPGDRVAIAAKNLPGYLEILFGSWWGGFVVVPINCKLHPSEIAWIVRDSGADALFVSSDLEGGIGGEDLGEAKTVIAIDSAAHRALSNHQPVDVVARAADDLAWIFYTSGTTGRPKGAMLSHRNLSAMTLSYLVEVDPTRPGDNLLHGAPMSHGSGLYAMSHVCRRATNVFPESGGFDAAEVLDLCGRLDGVSMFAAPTMVGRLAAAEAGPERPFRTLVWGGAPMHPTQTIEALDRFGPCLAQIYGQGESPMTISRLSKEMIAERDHPRWERRLASAGVPYAVIEVRVDGGEGDLGEVLVRGDTVMRGYWNNAQASSVALDDGWLRTGDIGEIDPEGFLTLVDRSKDLIISGGTNIYPREVEDVLLEQSGVREVAVIGRPDPEWGEVVVAFVAGDAASEDLDAACIDRIARFKRPKDYVHMQALPRNSTGKVLRHELRKLDAERTAPRST